MKFVSLYFLLTCYLVGRDMLEVSYRQNYQKNGRNICFYFTHDKIQISITLRFCNQLWYDIDRLPNI